MSAMIRQRIYFKVTWLLFWLHVLRNGVGGQLAHTTIFGLHTDAVASQTTHTWIQREFDFEDSTSEVTICLHFQLHFTYGSAATIMSMGRQLGFIVQDKEYGVLISKMYLSTQEMIQPWAWSHACVVFSGTSPEVVLNGKSTVPQITGPPTAINLGGDPVNVTIGLPSTYYDRSHTSFGGLATMPKIYARRLTRPEMVSLAHCGPEPDDDLAAGGWDVLAGEHNIIGSIEHGDDTVYTPATGAASVPRSFDSMSVASTEVCPPHNTNHYVVVAAQVDYHTAGNYCVTYGGSLPSPTDPGLLDAVKELNTKNPQLSFNFWGSGESNKKCTVINLRYGWDSFSLAEDDCKSDVAQIACKTSGLISMRLRYNDLQGDDEDLYYLVPDGVHPRFASVFGNKIEPDRDDPSLVLFYDKNNDVVAKGRAHSLQPIGRFDWWYTNINMTKTMALTACSEEQFTCDDGWCIPLSKRCDGTSDCRDSSDETCVLLQPLPESYRASRPHRPRTPVQLAANLLRIHDVDVDNNVMDACIMLISEWEDDRITFSQLSSNPSDNTIDDKDIWSPQYRLQNAEFLDAMAYVNRESVDVNVRVHRAGDGIPNVVHGVEGYMYTAGTNAYLERMEGFKAGYICDFQLAVYPFDVHECHMKIGIFHTGEFKAYYNISNLKINSEASVLNLYTSSQMCYDYTTDEEGLVTSITFKILLTRRYGSYVFTTFMPCIILSIIGSCTQFFGYTNFSDRIMVTLSCLIVVAALFSQVAVTAPASAVPKAIDIFFFYSTIRLFITFLHHSLLFFAQVYVKKKEEERLSSVHSMQTKTTDFGSLDDIPRAASYIKPKVAVPFLPWLQSERKREAFQELTFDRVFNVFGIIVGYLLDFICGLAFLLWVSNTRNAMAEKFENC